MVAFLQVGRQWINLDLVTEIELMGDEIDPTNVMLAKVHYCGGGQQDFDNNQDIDRIKRFLEGHRAQ
jgi:hypothetical protein